MDEATRPPQRGAPAAPTDLHVEKLFPVPHLPLEVQLLRCARADGPDVRCTQHSRAAHSLPLLVHMVDSKSAKTSRARRFLRNREAKLNENPKTALLVRGQKTSGLINSILIDLFMLKKPYGALLLHVEHAASRPRAARTPLTALTAFVPPRQACT